MTDDANHSESGSVDRSTTGLPARTWEIRLDDGSRVNSVSIDTGLNPLVAKPFVPRPEDPMGSADTEFVECCIGGYRFGIPTSYVIDSDVWSTAYLKPIPGNRSEPGVVGRTDFDGRQLHVIDLRQLFCLDDDLESDPQLFLVVDVQDDRFMLLVDGLISIQCVPPAQFKSFISLYVSGVKWLSGAMIFDHSVVAMLDLDALKRLLQDELRTE